MIELLEKTIAAHGGQQRWNEVTDVHADVVATGALWQVKQQPTLVAAVSADADPHSAAQHVSFTPFVREGWRGIFERDVVRVEDERSRAQEQRRDPRWSFEGHETTTPWDHLHTLYFAGYALWTYLTLPFVAAQPGFSVEEGEPWTENGESWRRLHVTFPSNVVSHCTEQVLYIDRHGLIRRHDYTAEVAGGGGAAHYLHHYKTFDGIVFPVLRQAVRRQPNNQPAKEPILVNLEFKNYVLH